MCKIRVSVSVSNQQQVALATEKLKHLPNVVEASITHKKGQVVAIVDHPIIVDTLQASSWVKDRFGMNSSFFPGAMVMA